MYRGMRQRTGFTIVEYAILFVVIVGALAAVHTPLRRAISHKWRTAADSIGYGRQYEYQGDHVTQVIEH